MDHLHKRFRAARWRLFLFWCMGVLSALWVASTLTLLGIWWIAATEPLQETSFGRKKYLWVAIGAGIVGGSIDARLLKLSIILILTQGFGGVEAGSPQLGMLLWIAGSLFVLSAISYTIAGTWWIVKKLYAPLPLL